MKKLIWMAAVLAAAAGCSKDRKATTVPESSFDEKNETIATETPATGEPFPSPDENVLAGGRGRTTPEPTEVGEVVIAVDPGAEVPEAVEKAVAVITPTQGNKVSGMIHFVEVGDGLAVHADLKGLPKGTHAFHVHVFGDCSSPDGESAGEHFNFSGSSMSPEESVITGNLGELVTKADGTATFESVIPDARLQGDHTILGRAVVIHEKGNDASKPPDGAAGKRLGCGVIGITQGEKQ